MNLELVEKIADSVMYEGYMLYPYTPSSVKNRQRWNFGVLHPPACDSSEMQVECLSLAGPDCALTVRVRFLQCPEGADTVARNIDSGELSLSELRSAPYISQFAFGAARGEVKITAVPLRETLFRLTLHIRNLTEASDALSRDSALALSMLSTHAVLLLRDGEFISSIDPPEVHREQAAACQNVGAWPVLAGSEGERDVMLASPIILYDYPQIAPESAGDLFDATEIDEILTLRILTLSDDEKNEIRAGDERTREILERTESLPAEQLVKMHGAIRGLRRTQR